MKFLLVTILFLSSSLCLADDLYDYTLKMDKNFRQVKKTKDIIFTARPNLFEKDFTLIVQQEKKADTTPEKVRNKWKDNYKSVCSNGYVFTIKFLLRNQNIDSNSDVNFSKYLANNIYLVNSMGEKAKMYKFTGDKNSGLNFSEPQREMVCFFNTITENDQPLIRKGVKNLKLVVEKYDKKQPSIFVEWKMPNSYKDLERPEVMTKFFGQRPIRTIIPRKVKVKKAPQYSIPKPSTKKENNAKI